jgi:Ca2+-binding RTX toxin-like protein
MMSLLIPSTVSRTRINGNVQFIDYDRELIRGSEGEDIQNAMSGTGTSNAPKLWNISLEKSDFLTFTQYNNRIYLRSGEFTMTGIEGNAIFGTYYGQGTSKEGYFYADLFFEFKGGMGNYQDATGSMNGNITNHPQYSATLMMEFKGMISH